MYVATVPNRGSPPAILLREGIREGKKVRTRTLANLSHWPPQRVEALRQLLRGETLLRAEDLFSITSSLAHGHVEAVKAAARRLSLDSLISSRPCRERDLVLGMIAGRVLNPSSKLAATRRWGTSTLAEEFSVEGATVDDLYEALDWLLTRKERIEAKLAGRHLREGGLALYDVSSSFYTGRTCSLARMGYERDGRRGLPIIVYGLLTDGEGCPVGVDIYPGNTGDPKTVPDQVEKLQGRFGLSRVVLVGDRGMLTQAQIDALRDHPGLSWISSLRGPAIRELVERGALQMSLFDEKDLAEISSPDYPGERLVACFNPLLAKERKRKREDLLLATESELERIQKEVSRRTKTPLQESEIGVKVGRVIGRFKMGKHFDWSIEKGAFKWSRIEESIRLEEALDGIYVVRTNEPKERLSAEDAVRNYKRLAEVERAFRCLKGIDLKVRPIHHRIDDRVRAHIFLCMLAYYLEWHMRKAWAPLLFEDEERRDRRHHRDPVAPAKPSASVKRKKLLRQTPDGLPVHSFQTLLENLATRCRNTCTLKDNSATFRQITDPSPLHSRALQLLDNLRST
ncbi:MAG TPA: IS1634 family transposase [Nitrososphaerales archaeon]|nr:IS1634 family transposase [Nitrososphaerales archaeon]